MGVAYVPTLQGADKYRAPPIPAVDVKWESFFANLRSSIGMDIVA